MEIEFPHKNAKAYKKDRLFYHFFYVNSFDHKATGLLPCSSWKKPAACPSFLCGILEWWCLTMSFGCSQESRCNREHLLLTN